MEVYLEAIDIGVYKAAIQGFLKLEWKSQSHIYRATQQELAKINLDCKVFD
jgi:hypothetical protein